MSNSRVIGKKQCPKCASSGNDRSRDNLALYSDGGQHCFSCSYHVRGSNQPRLHEHTQTKPKELDYNIPFDATTDLPALAIEWLRDYHITLNDLIRNKIMWSEQMQWLIFPIMYKSEIVGFQARNFNKAKPYKWYTKFKKKDYNIVLGQGNNIVICEDIVSAIRVGHHAVTVPIFGSLISTELLLELKAMNKPVKIWLDRDKAREAIRYSQKANAQGLRCSVIITHEDPKCYTSEIIKGILT